MGPTEARELSPLGPVRARLLLAGLPVFWLGGAIATWLTPSSLAGFFAGWLTMAVASTVGPLAGLSAVVRNDALRLTFPGSVLAVFTRARVSLRVWIIVSLSILAIGLAGFPRFILSP